MAGRRLNKKPEDEGPKLCPMQACGGELDEKGFCPIGEGYPEVMARCPEVCPVCRRHLAWEGSCGRCYSSGQPYPGLIHTQQGGHWVSTGERGRWTTREQSGKALRVIHRWCDGKITAEEMREEVESIVDPVPF